MFNWIKKKLAEWKEAVEEQRKINEALREISQEMHDIYMREFRKYYEPLIRQKLGEQNESKETDRTTSGV